MSHQQMSPVVHASETAAENVMDAEEVSQNDVERLTLVGHLTANIWKRWIFVISVMVAALQVFGLIQLGWVRMIIAAPVLSVIVWLVAELVATQRTYGLRAERNEVASVFTYAASTEGAVVNSGH